MKEINELQMIRERHSVRSYKRKPLTAEHLALLNEALDEINEESGLRMVYVTKTKGVFTSPMMRLIGWKHYPGFIALIGKNADDREERCGYYGEKLILYLQALGINTCWVGMFKRNAVPVELAPDEKVVVTIVLGYGNNQGKQHKSKSFEDVTEITTDDIPQWFRNGVECALLAPTAVNRQDFKISFDGENVDFIPTGKGNATMTDLGIIKYHFEIGSRQ